MTKNKIPVNVIMTFGSQNQKSEEIKIPEYVMYCKEDFLEWIVRDFITEKDDMLDLIKISTSVIGEISNHLENHMMGNKNKVGIGWFMKYNGKFYRQCGDFNTLYPLFNIYHTQGGDELVEKESKVLSREDGIDIEVKYYQLIHPSSSLQSITINNDIKKEMK